LGWLPLMALLMVAGPAFAQEKFKETRSGAQYVHHIQLYDVAGNLIDPSSPDARPYSPMQTCKKCHDYKAISHGYHFNAAEKLGKDATDRPGEPWIYTDPRTGTQMPLSYRDRAGLFKPRDAGLTRFKFLLEFGRQMPGGGVGEHAVASDGSGTDATKPQAAAEPDEARFKISGALEIDCLMCHSNSREYSHERWIKQIAEQNFAWAATYALGIAKVKGSAKALPDDFDPAKKPEGDAAASAPKLPETHYDAKRFDEEKYIFIDVIRKPSNNACYQCHTTRSVGEGAEAKWAHDADVHVKAGIACADCHRNDIGHNTVRGFAGEKHPAGADVHTLSCRGCHLDQNDGTTRTDLGGRLGAPKPLHRGIPPIHFDRMSCTACHSGPVPGSKPGAVQTSMAHAFGVATQTRDDSDLPAIVQPVYLQLKAHPDDKKGVVTPHRMVWPAYWGWVEGDKVTPMDPGEVYTKTLRRVLRIRSDFRAEASKATLTDDDRKAALGEAANKPDAELTAEQKARLGALLKTKSAEAFSTNVAKVLVEMQKTNTKAKPVYIANGKMYSIGSRDETKIEGVEHAAGKPYAWPLGHDVRPARQSLGVTGCTECHAKDTPMFHGSVTAAGPASDDEPVTNAMHELLGEDPKMLAAWEQSFGGRSMFKWLGFVTIGAVAVIVVLFLLLGLNGLLKVVTRRN
jgi:hypothetical protein